MAEYIDRTALGISYADPKAFINPAHAEGWNTAIQIINEAPAADVAPVVHGRWVDVGERYDDYDECFYSVFKCSNCGTAKEEYPTSNYCPNCGAKMDEEVNVT